MRYLGVVVLLLAAAIQTQADAPAPAPSKFQAVDAEASGAKEKAEKTSIVGYNKEKMTKDEIEKEKMRIEKVCKCKVENLASVGAFILTYDDPKHASISSLSLDPSMETGMEDEMVTIFDDEIPTDPEFDQQWALQDLSNNADINAAEGWKKYISDSLGGDPSGPSVVVAVIDTGVDYNHLDLKDVMWKNTGETPGNGLDDDGNGYVDDVYGYDFNYGDADPIDVHSHGTHCAGIIAAKENNGKGIAGVASFAQGKVKIMAVKGLSDGGGGSISNLLKCLNYAIDNGATISSNSWGSGGSMGIGQDKLWKMVLQNNPDHLFVAAAGNSNRLIDDTYRPWTCGIKEPNLFCVASSTEKDTRSSFSNYGKEYVHVFAPGSNIYSTVPGNGYGTKSGTSMACPHVSGLAALIRTMKPAMNAQQVREAIEANVQKKKQYENVVSSGGLIDMGNTLKVPINGGWSYWSGYSPCSVTCGDGIKTRVRTCTNPPPSDGGKQCPGSDKKEYKCNLKQCLPGDCEDGKPDPVDTRKNWPSKSYSSYSCFDVNGNSYKRGESLESCCGCFTFTCSYIYDKGFYIFFWTKFRQDSCCQDCEGTVFPAGSIMKSVELDDACNTTKKTECIYISQEKKAVIQESSTYKDCCTNSSGVYLKGTSMLVPATCSIEKCDRSPGRQEAAWIYTQELAGCNCCVYNGSLINDGGWVILDDGKNATCCDGRLVVGIENTFPDEKCFLEDTNITFHDLGKNQYGQETKPVWIIDQGGRRLIETKNTRPSVGVSNLGDPTKPVSFSGRVFSNASDRDVIGMVFGYQNDVNFFVVASAGTNRPGPTNWYVGRLHATCETSCAETRTISDAIWDPTSHPKDITILSSGTNYWSSPNIYSFSICFNPSKLLLSTAVFEMKEDSKFPVLDTGTISAKTGNQALDDMSKHGGFIGVYVDSQMLTTWDQLDCADCDLTG